jgi:hypothetical protein
LRGFYLEEAASYHLLFKTGDLKTIVCNHNEDDEN